MSARWLGEIRESEFEALFGIMDVDASGDVDFVEFASFMGQISGNIEAEIKAGGEKFDDHGVVEEVKVYDLSGRGAAGENIDDNDETGKVNVLGLRILVQPDPEAAVETTGVDDPSDPEAAVGTTVDDHSVLHTIHEA